MTGLGGGGGGTGESVEWTSPAIVLPERTHARATAIKKRLISGLP